MERRVSHLTVLALNLPSCAILAVDSRVCGPSSRILSNTYNKMIQLRPNVFLGCFGDCNVIDQVVDALSNLPNNPLLVGEIALYVQNTVNRVLEMNPIDEEENGEKTTRFVLLGRCFDDTRHYFYTITKRGPNNWMYFARREMGRVVCAGSRAVTSFLRENNLDENMTEDEAVDYAFRCVRFSVLHSWVSGGIIQAAAMKPAGSSIVHTWEQMNPRYCTDEYHYQEPRSNHGY